MSKPDRRSANASQRKLRSEGVAFGSRLQVEHSGVSPTEYNKRNYVDEGGLERGRQQVVREPLPALMPVTRPQKAPSSTHNPKADKAIEDANKKDLQNRGL